MLHAQVSDRKTAALSNATTVPRRKEMSPPCGLGLGRNYWGTAGAIPAAHNLPAAERHRAPANAQTVYGNQAILRMVNRSRQSRSAASFVGQSDPQKLQRKEGCACGGHCAKCSGKASPKPASFTGELQDVFQQMPPDGGQPAPVTPDAGAPDGGGGAEPAQAAAPAASPCSVLCDQAYANPALNGGGGGVVCMNGVKCACVFDVAPLRRGQCPGFDAIVMAHERRHLPETDCPPNAPIQRLGPRAGVDLTAVECTHRRESIAEMDAIIPGSAGICRTGMVSIRAELAAWVSANCGGAP